MGLLDDAIRQHLDLKRLHGADPGDVAKLEHEAFGPVEREDALAVPDPGESSAAVPGDAGDDAAVAHEEEVAYKESELEAEEEWTQTHPVPQDAEPSGGSVRLDAVPDEPTAPGEHDELEETPEFLQETPEHDRLWFEQKPPRDFDF